MSTAARQAAYSRRLRNEVLSLLGGVCVRCGFSDRRALQVDHVHGDGAAQRRETPATTGMLRRILTSLGAGEQGKYQILCANCNWIKRCEEREYG